MCDNTQELNNHKTSEEQFLKLRTKVLAYLGGDSNENKKPTVCWNYVKNDKCSHLAGIIHEPRIIKNLWHPEINEKNYLKDKNIGKRF
jgi:hypothetical protein